MMDSATQNFLELIEGRAGNAVVRDIFAVCGLPNKRTENYHYTDLRAGFNEIEKPEIAALQAQYMADIEIVANEEGVVIKGKNVGVKISEGYIASDNDNQTALIAFGLARQFFKIEIAANCEVSIEILRAAGSNFALEIKAGDNSHLSVFETQKGLKGLSSFDFSYRSGKNCAFDYYRQIVAGAGRDIYFANICAAENSQIHLFNLSLGGKLSRQEMVVNLNGQGVNASLNGAYILNQAHNDFTFFINHLAPECTSKVNVRGAAGERGDGVFQGKVEVARDAQKTQSNMSHRGLMLNESARINAKPGLEIYADDVECSHGNTIGALAEDALFYMRQRGISEKTARSMLVQAFLVEVFDEIENYKVKDNFNNIIASRLNGGVL